MSFALLPQTPRQQRKGGFINERGSVNANMPPQTFDALSTRSAWLPRKTSVGFSCSPRIATTRVNRVISDTRGILARSNEVIE